LTHRRKYKLLVLSRYRVPKSCDRWGIYGVWCCQTSTQTPINCTPSLTYHSPQIPQTSQLFGTLYLLLSNPKCPQGLVNLSVELVCKNVYRTKCVRTQYLSNFFSRAVKFRHATSSTKLLGLSLAFHNNFLFAKHETKATEQRET